MERRNALILQASSLELDQAIGLSSLIVSLQIALGLSWRIFLSVAGEATAADFIPSLSPQSRLDQ